MHHKPWCSVTLLQLCAGLSIALCEQAMTQACSFKFKLIFDVIVPVSYIRLNNSKSVPINIFHETSFDVKQRGFSCKSTTNPDRSRKWRHGGLCLKQSPPQTPLQIASGTETYHALEKSSQLILKTFSALCGWVCEWHWRALLKHASSNRHTAQSGALATLMKNRCLSSDILLIGSIRIAFFPCQDQARRVLRIFVRHLKLCLWNSTNKFNSKALELITS